MVSLTNVTAAGHDYWLHMQALRDPIMRQAACQGLGQIMKTRSLPQPVRLAAARGRRWARSNAGHPRRARPA